MIARAPQFDEALLVCDVDVAAAGAARLRDTRQRAGPYEARADVALLGSLQTRPPGPQRGPRRAASSPSCSDRVEEVYARARAGHPRLRRARTASRHVVLGLSGGIDSALVACVAVDALGPDAVTCVTMPSRYTSDGTFGDAQAIAANLGVRLIELPIAGVVAAYEEQLAGLFEGPSPT